MSSRRGVRLPTVPLMKFSRKYLYIPRIPEEHREEYARFTAYESHFDDTISVHDSITGVTVKHAMKDVVEAYDAHPNHGIWLILIQLTAQRLHQLNQKRLE